MNDSFSNRIEKFLYTADFSKESSERVWEKILRRLGSGRELSYDELSDAAGGVSKPLGNENGGVKL